MIKVLIVEDSKAIQEFLDNILSSDPDVLVAGVASSGYEAIELLKIKKPDIITIDINLSGMDGYETTRRIMESFPTPIVIISGIENPKEVTNPYSMIRS